MDTTMFFIVAVVMGMATLGVVLWRFAKGDAVQSGKIALLLGVLGFVLISSPLWSQMAISVDKLEMSFLREQAETTSEDYLALLEAYTECLSPEEQERLKPVIKDMQTTVNAIPNATDQKARDQAGGVA